MTSENAITAAANAVVTATSHPVLTPRGSVWAQESPTRWVRAFPIPDEAVRGVRAADPCESRRQVILGADQEFHEESPPRPLLCWASTPHPATASSEWGATELPLPQTHPPRYLFFCIYFSCPFISSLKYNSEPQIDPTQQPRQ